uniref:C2H2-type domain-containing protein n=1 Tax=Amphilophus citrinellus TaxID=61819 RepID=A0A3Q0SYC4_AMPCI
MKWIQLPQTLHLNVVREQGQIVLFLEGFSFTFGKKKKRNPKTKKIQTRYWKQSTSAYEPEDRRFLSTRPVNKSFTEEETKCLICEKLFEHPNQLKTHTKLHSFPYHCIQCEKGFTSQSGELLLHNRSHTGETPYTCIQCGKGFSSKSHLNVHMRSHTGERPYLCSECPKRFLTLNCLKRHTLSHNGVKPFKPACY